MNKILNGVEVPMTAEEIAEVQADAPTEAEALADRWQAVRHHRNGLLRQTDWRAKSDVTLSDDWKTYRKLERCNNSIKSVGHYCPQNRVDVHS